MEHASRGIRFTWNTFHGAFAGSTRLTPKRQVQLCETELFVRTTLTLLPHLLSSTLPLEPSVQSFGSESTRFVRVHHTCLI